MKKFLMLAILFFAPPAFAQEAMSPAQMLAHCEAKWGNRTSAVAQCVTNLRLAHGEATDVAIMAELDELGDKVDGFVATQSSTPQVTATSTGATTRTGGAAWVPVAQPTVVSIHSLNGMVPDTLHIEGLNGSSLRQTCGGVGAPLAVFLDHGVPITNVYVPVGAPTGFVQVYWDRNNDGTPDGTVWALDLQSQDDVWVTWGLQNDLEVRYLRPGVQIAVAGLPLQWVYHPTTRRENPGSGAVGCEKSHLEPRGGHRVTRSMARVW